jgi:hypothetical protein
MLAPRLVPRHQQLQVPAQELGVVHEAERAVDVHGHVVPGGHHAPVLGLGGIPRRGDVRVRALEDDQRLARRRRLPVVRVGARDVPLQHAVLPVRAVQHQREVSGEQPFGG